MRICTKCKTEKDDNDFYRRSDGKCGFQSQCKLCMIKNSTKWYVQKIGNYKFKNTKHQKANDNERSCAKCNRTMNVDNFHVATTQVSGYSSLCKDCFRAYRKTNEWKDSNLRATKKWSSLNSDKVKAHRKVQNSIRRGKLNKGRCEVCGSEKAHAHHEDYSKPLEVIWLCHDHHTKLHREKRNVVSK